MPVIRRLHHNRVIPKGRLSEGDEVVAINGHPIRDLIDTKFYAADENLELAVRRVDGTEATVRIRKAIDSDLGIEWEPDKIRVCKADCDFCFVKQQPKKVMRRTLYIKDDDYRLSFLYGNFVTLTNMTKEDYDRIFEQRLTPLYVSVHSTDDEVRRVFLRKPDAEPILPLLKWLHEHGIVTHTQVVVTPGLNDGKPLWKSFDELLALYPEVPSVGVVPIGLTKHRSELPGLKLVPPEMANEILDELEKRHKKMRKKHGSGAIYGADEMYLIAGRPIPDADYYDDFPQLENGVGLVRQLIDKFDETEAELPRRLARPLRFCVITGASAGPFITEMCERATRRVKNLDIVPLVVRNEFWGESVTVSGLLTANDMATQFAESGLDVDAVILPPDCLNTDGLFLDDETVEGMESRLERPVLTSSYDFIDTIKRNIAAVRSAAYAGPVE
jgi:putative radical SAM enzyme (TIGR03279 family)